MALALPGSGAMALPSGSTVVASPATGDRTTTIATMQKFAYEFDGSLTPNGYQKLPSGLIIQWGSVTISLSTQNSKTSAVTFPTPFPGACVGVQVTSTSGAQYGYVTSITASGCTLGLIDRDSSSTPTVTAAVQYLAFGY